MTTDPSALGCELSSEITSGSVPASGSFLISRSSKGWSSSLTPPMPLSSGLLLCRCCCNSLSSLANSAMPYCCAIRSPSSNRVPLVFRIAAYSESSGMEENGLKLSLESEMGEELPLAADGSSATLSNNVSSICNTEQQDDNLQHYVQLHNPATLTKHLLQ